MAWTTPRTWVTGETVTAALMNAHVRDNLLETSAATATTAGDIVYADGNKSMGSRLAIHATSGAYMTSTGTAPRWNIYDVLQSSNSDTLSTASLGTSYLPMNSLDGGTIPDITTTVTINASGKALALWACRMSGSVTGKTMLVSVEISGATTQAASDNTALAFESSAADAIYEAGTFVYFGSLNSGSTTFRLRARSESINVATFDNPRIMVFPL